MLFVTETWLHTEISSGLLDPHLHYYILRKDRCTGVGGGVAAFVNRRFVVSEVQVDEVFADVELLCFDVVARAKSKMRYFVVYRPPNYDSSAKCYMELLTKCLKQYCEVDCTSIIVGDFNIPTIDWADLTHCTDYISTLFAGFVTTGGFTQFVNFHTRGNNLLDLVLSNDSEIVCSISPKPPLGHSDHSMIDFKLDVRTSDIEGQDKMNTVESLKYYWHKADFSGLEQSLSQVDWNTFICFNANATSVWSAFLNTVWDSVKEFVPHNGASHSSGIVNKRKRHPRHIRKLIIKKRHLWRELQNDKGNLNKRRHYQNCTSDLRAQTRLLVEQQEINVIQSNNIGLFYRHINSRITYRKVIGALVDGYGNAVTSDRSKADMFNTYYSSVGVADNGCIPVCNIVSVNSTLETVRFTESDVIAAINKLKPNLSSGPDRLPPLLFKKLKYTLSYPLSLIFTQLLSVGIVPHDWTKAIIVPVYKKGVSGDVANYRPISLTCVASKLMERVIAKHIYAHLAENNLLSQAQHGFVSGHSTCTNLLECLNDWTLTVQRKKAVTVAYIDFSRAFDSVSHNKLLAKLHSYGIRGEILLWLEHFFKIRTHQTRVGDCLSDEATLISGVIQGSGIGPVSFLIFVDELAKILERHGVVVKLFADDVKVYLEICNTDDATKLQMALDLITNWSDEWQLGLSIGKCNTLLIGKQYDDTQYYIDGVELPCLPHCRDLGVTITSELSSALHIQQITTKAHQRANSILRCFVSGNVTLLVRAFVVYVRPVLEYNSIIWSPHLKQEIMMIEKVQRRFTKRLHGCKALTYTDRLAKLGLPSLELRRLHLDLIYCYKIVFGLTKLNFVDFFEFSTLPTGGMHTNFSSQEVVTLESIFFACRVINVWNGLPDFVSFTSIAAFKRSIRTVDFSEFLMCNNV